MTEKIIVGKTHLFCLDHSSIGDRKKISTEKLMTMTRNEIINSLVHPLDTEDETLIEISTCEEKCAAKCPDYRALNHQAV